MFKERVISPLRIQRNKKGDMWSLNLNNLNNTHHQAYNTLKVRYTKEMKEQIEALPVFDCPLLVTCVIYPATKRKFDIDNVGAVQAKMFLDALEKYGKIEGDDYRFIPELRYKFGDVDPQFPRCEIILQEY